MLLIGSMPYTQQIASFLCCFPHFVQNFTPMHCSINDIETNYWYTSSSNEITVFTQEQNKLRRNAKHQ
jgi:hypothetical protein